MPRTSFGIRCMQSVVADGTHQTPPKSPLTQMSLCATKACIPQSKMFSVKCIMLTSVTNRLSDRWFIRCVITWKSLGHILPAGVFTGYGPKAGRLGATPPNAPISRPVISIFYWLKKFSHGKGIFNNDWRKTSCHFLATDTEFLCGSVKIFAESLYFWETQNSKNILIHSSFKIIPFYKYTLLPENVNRRKNYGK